MRDEKTKINPFGDVLLPDETLVWSYTPQPMPFVRHFVRYLVLCVIGIFILAFLFAVLTMLLGATGASRSNLTGQPWPSMLISRTRLNLLVMAPCALPLLLLMYPIVWASNRRIGKSTYGITSKRLLMPAQGRVTGIALKDVRYIHRWRQTLSFGSQFPTWTDLEDPQAVKARIEQARNDQE